MRIGIGEYYIEGTPKELAEYERISNDEKPFSIGDMTVKITCKITVDSVEVNASSLRS